MKFILGSLVFVFTACSSLSSFFDGEETPETAPAVAAADQSEQKVVAQTDPLPMPSADRAQAPETPPPSSEGSGSYTVLSGDTLMKIAYKVYGDLYRWKEILSANPSATKLESGTVLRIPGEQRPPERPSGEAYTIREGDTLGTIAKSLYGSPDEWKKIWKHNKAMIKDPNQIFIGFVLYYEPAEHQLAEAPAAIQLPSNLVANQ